MFFKTAAIASLLFVASTSAHPGGIPRLVGRNGFIDIRDLQPVNELVKRVESVDGTCGGTNGYTCGTTVNRCCSQYGWCGDSDGHCLPSNNCQPQFGICAAAGTTSAAGTATSGGATPTTPPETGRCGTAANGTICPTGQCCSESGYCGTTEDHCMSPMCQIGFGRCDADITPAGDSTANVTRPKVGSVPYDDGFYACNTVGEVAMTYDDGPDVYTDGMLDLLASYNAKATFFITGINNGKGAIDTTPAWSAVIRKMYQQGHQLASHTWSHADLSALTEARRRDEMIKLEMALRNIVGFFPTYMRPPYSSCNASCVATMQDLGYHIAYFDLDTDDYNNVTPQLIQNAKDNVFRAINPSNPQTRSFLSIAHDIHQQTAQNLTGYMLDLLQQKGYKAVTLGQCLGDPEANWYRGNYVPPSSSASTAAPTSSSARPTSTVANTTSAVLTSTVANTTTALPTSTVASTTTALPTSTVASTTTALPTSTVASTTTTLPTSTSGPCAYSVGTWCATPLPTYTDIAGCWIAVGNCWEQGNSCWNTVPWPTSNRCANYQDACQLQETHCDACFENETVSGGACPFLTPVYGTSIPNPSAA